MYLRDLAFICECLLSVHLELSLTLWSELKDQMPAAVQNGYSSTNVGSRTHPWLIALSWTCVTIQLFWRHREKKNIDSTYCVPDSILTDNSEKKILLYPIT